MARHRPRRAQGSDRVGGGAAGVRLLLAGRAFAGLRTVFDKERKIVGLVFDDNNQSPGGDYGFDETVNRTVAVHSAALMETLEHIYGAKCIVRELKSSAASASGTH